ncbi:hypothetical protein E4U41_004245 [Claviceps citrina]|nr:hypothetical protein E4U41_004245 [Claviceps citrina]
MASRHTPVVRADDSFWADLDRDSIVQPLDALGIADPNVRPNRYAVQRGRIVPQRHCVDVVLPSQNEDRSIRSNLAPPRRSSRRLQQRARRGRDPAWRPTSSVYSYSDGELSPPTPEYTLASSDTPGGSAALQISPPSSPDLHGAAKGLVAGDVSPLDDDSDDGQRTILARSRPDTRNLPPQQHKASIPRPSQAARRVQNAVPPPRRQAMPPTDEEAWNQPVHTRQAINYSENDQTSRHVAAHEQPYGITTMISSAANDRTKSSSPSFGQRMRLVGKTKPSAIDRRPPWNGASGRSVMVQPVMDDLTVAPLNLPPKNDQRTRGHAEKSGGASSGGETMIAATGGSAMRRLLLPSKNRLKESTAQTTQVSAEKQRPMPESAYTSPPKNDILAQEAAGPHDAPSMDLQTQALRSHPPDLFHPSLNVIKRKPPPASSPASSAPNKVRDVDFLDGARESPGDGAAAHVPSDSPSQAVTVPPPSRFSITTYATSDAGTPRQSSEESVPPPPVLPPVLGVMDRSRPLAGGRSRSSGSEQPIFIDLSSSFKSTEEQQEQHGSANRRNQGAQNRSVSDTRSAENRPSSSLSTSKPLPLAPHQGKDGDLVSQLDAQISDLFHRRVNIEKSIKQMTQLMPRDNLLASDQVVRKREEEKKKVDYLRQELAEIQRREHELGLKLYRARKRQDKEADFESTPLWVSRVAG